MSNVIEVSSLQKQKTEVQYYSGFPALANISIRVAIMVGVMVPCMVRQNKNAH